MRFFLARIAAGCSLLLGLSVMSTGGALGVTLASSSPQAVKAGVESSRQMPAPVQAVVPVKAAPVLIIADEDYVPPGVDVAKSVSTAAVVNAAKVKSYPRRQVSSSSSAPWLVSGGVPAGGLVVAAMVAPADPVTGLATSTPAGQPLTPGLVSHVPAACVGTGSDGSRVQMVYAVEEGKVDRYAAVAPSLASFAADVDDVFALSSRKTDAGRRVRWVHDASCNISVEKAILPAGSLGTSADSQGAFQTMRAALVAAGFNVESRKYLVFADAEALCGLGEMYVDSRKSPNYNDAGYSQYARVDTACWSTVWTGGNPAAHELMHTLGAVQADAPNSSGSHCTDEYDQMCYDDGSGKAMTWSCSADQESVFDCGNDDYFNAGANLDPNSYLGSHWNTADSSYLTPAPVLAPSPVVTGPDQILAGDSAVFTASQLTTTTFEWAVQGGTGCTASPVSGLSTTVSCPVTAVAGPIKVLATGMASDGQWMQAFRQSSVSLPPLQTAPGAPDIGTTTPGDASATVTWTAPANGGSAITGYMVRVVDGAGVQVGVLRQAAADATSLAVTSLVNGTKVRFQVQATNAVGTGVFSVLSAAVTPAAVPGAPVIGTASSGKNRGTIDAMARWTPALSNGGSVINGYVVTALRMNAAGVVVGQTVSAVQAASVRSLTMILPAPANQYRFVVQARNVMGLGAISARSNLVTAQ